MSAAERQHRVGLRPSSIRKVEFEDPQGRVRGSARSKSALSAQTTVDLIEPRLIVRPLAAQYMTTLRRGPVFGSTGPNQKPGTRSMRDVVFAHGFWTQDRWPIARSPETVSEWVVYETQSAQRNTDIPAHQGCRARRGITPGATLRAGGRSPTRVRKDQRIGRLAIRVRLEAAKTRYRPPRRKCASSCRDHRRPEETGLLLPRWQSG